MDKSKLLKLAKLVMQFGECNTDKGILTYDGGELTVGTEVFVEVEGEYVPAPDGEYMAEGQKIKVKEGKVEEIEVVEPEPTPEPEPEPREEDMVEEPTPEPEPEPAPDRTAELEAEVARLQEELAVRDTEIETLRAENEELKAENETLKNKPIEDPIKMNKTEQFEKIYNIENKALKYFE